MITRFLGMFAVGFGTGLLKPMPGTWGTLPGVLIAWILQLLPVAVAIFIYALLVFVAYYAADVRGRIVEDWDHPTIVCDEIVGVIPMLWQVPVGLDWIWIFLLFRALDIVKPLPISWVDKNIHGPLGCLLDDLLAGLFGCLMVWSYFSWVS